jgi:hypothetical protein
MINSEQFRRQTEADMFNLLKVTAIVFLFAVHVDAYGGITAIAIGSSADVPGENWAANSNWHLRAILVDNSGNSIGGLSPEIPFSVGSGGAVPSGITVTLDSTAPAGSTFLIYRSHAPIRTGDTLERAGYTNLCDPSGCLPGTGPVPMSGRWLNSDFMAGNTAMPVKLQDFSVD